jgi:hypothetical protein
VIFHATRKCGDMGFAIAKCGQVVFSRSQKLRVRGVFTLPENVGTWCFNAARKCGHLIVLHYQKMWAINVFTCPENVGTWYFDATRKCGNVMWQAAGKSLPGRFGKKCTLT